MGVLESLPLPPFPLPYTFPGNPASNRRIALHPEQKSLENILFFEIWYFS
jgi:hypothetical protein